MAVQLKIANRESERSLSEHSRGLTMGSYFSGMGRFGKPFGRGYLALVILILSSGSMQLAQGQRVFEAGPVPKPSQKEKPQAATKKPIERDLSDYQVTELGPHHRKWQRLETITNLEGEKEEVVRSYTELGTGLNRWDANSQEWVESIELIEKFRGGAAALNGQQQVIFSSNIKNEGSVDILNPDGVRIRSSVLGFAYFDALTGEDAIIAEVKGSVGEIIPPNQIIYRDAFNDVEADVLYTYRRTGVVQDIILRENPPEPETFGLSNLTSRLEAMTEFFDVKSPTKEEKVLQRRVDDPVLRELMEMPDLTDETLGFGEMKMIEGTAFGLGGAADQEKGNRDPIYVGKKWEEIEGRKVLFESLEYETVEPFLKKLPRAGRKRAALERGDRLFGPEPLLADWSVPRELPQIAYLSPQSDPERVVEIAMTRVDERPGFVIDYTTISSWQSHFVFERGQTYLVTSWAYLTGVARFEGGSVIKYNNSTLLIYEDVSFESTIRSPVIFTSMHDDSFGEVIAGSSGVPPAAPYNSTYLYLSGRTDLVMENFHMKYGHWGIFSTGGSGHRVSNATFTHCHNPLIVSGTQGMVVENVLLHDFFEGIYCYYSSCSASHVTAHDGSHLVKNGLLTLQNSLIVDVDSISSYSGRYASHNVEVSSSSGVFESSGGGLHYLATGSPYRDLATATNNPTLEAELKTLTTSAPVEIPSGSSLGANTFWQGSVPLDDDAMLDLGYHYPKLDYVIDDVQLNPGVTLTVEAGTALGIASHGIHLEQSASLVLNGSPSDRIEFFSQSDFQESRTPGAPVYATPAYLSFNSGSPGGSLIAVAIRYSDFNSGAGAAYEFLNSNGPLSQSVKDLTIRDSRFFHGVLSMNDSVGTTQVILNNQFWETHLSLRGQQELDFRNNHVASSEMDYLQTSGSGLWTLKDNVFTELDPTVNGTLVNAGHGHNAYVNTGERIGGTTHGSDLVLSSLAYESGPYGDYYQLSSSPLINAGSQGGDAAGLYHHTVLVGGAPEALPGAVTVVDIGFHYPAIDAGTGELLDVDSDTLVNIVEDLNGNGLQDPGESPWQVWSPPLVYTFQVFTPLDQ
ncbi:hypothetical protein N8737_04210 [Verrucomicrobia bacterium]|nr:hypothetical protein [Verrucomicrobiota bacterium]